MLAFIVFVGVFRPEPWLTAILALAPVSWFVTALGRTENTPRYTYVSVLLLLMAVAALFGAGRVRVRAPILLVLVAFSVAANTAYLFSYGDFARRQEERAAPQVMAVDTAAPVVAGAFRLGPPLWFGQFQAHFYLRFVKHLPGSAYHGVDRIRRLLPWQQRIADSTLIRAERLALRPATGVRVGTCTTRRAPVFTIELRPGSHVVIRAGAAPAAVRLRRFAPAFQRRPLGTIAAHRRAILATPRDRAPDSWRVQIASPRGATACAAAGTVRG